MKWIAIIGAILLFSLFGHSPALGTLATLAVGCALVIPRVIKKKKQQIEAEEKAAEEQLAAYREKLELEKERKKIEQEEKAAEEQLAAYREKIELEKEQKRIEQEEKARQEEQRKIEAERAKQKAYDFIKCPVKGAFAHEDDIFHNLMEHNPEYDYNKKDMIDFCVADTPIYKWIPKNLPTSLVPEPDNKYDPNAIRVEVGGILIGYIPKQNCLQILEDMSAGKIVNVSHYITGGAYKILAEDYDSLKDKSKYTVETGSAELSAEVYIKVRAN